MATISVDGSRMAKSSATASSQPPSVSSRSLRRGRAGAAGAGAAEAEAEEATAVAAGTALAMVAQREEDLHAATNEQRNQQQAAIRASMRGSLRTRWSEGPPLREQRQTALHPRAIAGAESARPLRHCWPRCTHLPPRLCNRFAQRRSAAKTLKLRKTRSRAALPHAVMSSSWPTDDPDALGMDHLRLGSGGSQQQSSLHHQPPSTPDPPHRAYSAFGGGALHSAFGGGLFFQQHAASPPTAAGSGWESAQPHPSPAQPMRPPQQHNQQTHQSMQPQQQQPFPGLFGMSAPPQQQQPLSQPPPQQQTFNREAFDARFGAPAARGPSMPPQQLHQQQQLFHDHSHNGAAPSLQPQHQQPQSQSQSQPQGRSILNEVMSLMAPQPTQQQNLPPPHMQTPQQQGFNGPNQQQQNGPPRGFPPQSQPPGPLRPPLAGGSRAPMPHQQGPPGFKAPPGFAMQPPPHQQQSQQSMQHQLNGFAGPPPGMSSGGAPASFAGGPPSSSPLPQPLQGESHVQCSICRVVVLNTPQALFMHDHSPQHMQNDLRLQQSRQQQLQQQQQPQQEMRQLPPHQQQQQQQPLQQPFHEQPSNSPPSRSPQLQPSPVSASASPLLTPPMGSPLPPLDLPSLQAQLRSFMAAQEETRARGLPPLVMDPQLLNQLKLMQNLYQQPQQQQQQQMQRKQSNGDDHGPVDAAVAAAAALTASCTASGGHIYPSRAALIAAASEIHLRPMHRNAGRMHGGGGRVSVPQGMESELRRLLATLQPDPRTFEVREELRSMIERIVQDHWGKDRCRVMLFGSSVNTLCETHSDVDLCLEFKPDPAAAAASASASSASSPSTDASMSTASSINKPEIVETLAVLLGDSMREILALPKARVPIVKFKAPPRFDSLDCDIGINNHLAVRNSALIRDYMSLDPRARDLTRIIKHWAKLRKINDTYRGTLSSYAYVVLVIHFLQNTSPPILPCLQSAQTRKDAEAPCVIDGFDCWYQTDLSLFSGFGSANPASLSELVLGFFKLYASEFDYKEHILSIRCSGGYLDKKQKVWGLSGKKDRHLVSQEDTCTIRGNREEASWRR